MKIELYDLKNVKMSQIDKLDGWKQRYYNNESIYTFFFFTLTNIKLNIEKCKTKLHPAEVPIFNKFEFNYRWKFYFMIWKC